MLLDNAVLIAFPFYLLLLLLIEITSQQLLPKVHWLECGILSSTYVGAEQQILGPRSTIGQIIRGAKTPVSTVHHDKADRME